MSPHNGWLPPISPKGQFWPSEPPPGLGRWGDQTEHRLEALEQQMALGPSLVEEINDLRDRLKKLEDKKPSNPAGGWLANPNVLMLLYLAVGVLVTIATGKIPDFSAVIK